MGRWLHAFIVAWPIAVLAAFFCAPLARTWTTRLIVITRSPAKTVDETR
jgi:hypothetical protein